MKDRKKETRRAEIQELLTSATAFDENQHKIKEDIKSLKISAEDD